MRMGRSWNKEGFDSDTKFTSLETRKGYDVRVREKGVGLLQNESFIFFYKMEGIRVVKKEKQKKNLRNWESIRKMKNSFRRRIY